MTYKELLEAVKERLTEEEQNQDVWFCFGYTVMNLFFFKCENKIIFVDEKYIRARFKDGKSVEDLSISLNISGLEVEKIIREGF